MMAAITYSNQDINRFWPNILADNAIIVYNAFSPANVEDARYVTDLANKFDDLTSRAEKNLTGDQLNQLNTDAYATNHNYRIFLIKLLDRLLTKRIYFDLKPEIVNDMLNITEYYTYLLNIFMQGKQPVLNPILEAIFWLSSFVMQCRYIADNLGYYESIYREKAVKFANIFNEDLMGAMEFQGFSRIGKTEFPAVIEHQKLLEKIMTDYYEYLFNLINLVNANKLSSSISVLFLDRSRRMACLYLTNLSILNNNKKPDCDPFAKRISSI